MAASIVCRRNLHKIRNVASYRHRYCPVRHGTNSSTGAYFIFIPEVPKDTRQNNAIMRYDQFPEFNLSQNMTIRGSAKLSLEYDSKFVQLVDTLPEDPKQVKFEDLFDKIEGLLAPVNYAENQATILSVSDFVTYTKTMLDRVQLQLDRSRKERFQNEEIYSLVKEFDSRRDSLTDVQKRLLDIYLFESKSTGIDLKGKDSTFIQTQLTKLYNKQIEFLEKVSQHSSLFYLDLGAIQWEIMREMPQHVRYYMALDKSEPDRGPWKVTLLGYVIDSFIEVCPFREYRYKVWNANNTVGTHIKTDVRLHTFEIPEAIRECRRDLAEKTGYEHYAAMCMQNRMAGSVQTILSMIDTYRNHFHPMAVNEVTSLQEYAEKRGFKDTLKQWDIPYYRRHQCQSLYKMHGVDRLPYFSYDVVRDKLFRLCEQLFSIKIEQLEVGSEGVSVWHPDVTVYNVHDQDGTYLSRFYLDPFGRRGVKLRQDATEIGRERCDVLQLTPISYVILNIEKNNVPGLPSLMSYKEVLAMFYQFGNAMQQLLTTAPYSELAGQKNIELDASHVASYLLKMFASEPSMIRDMSTRQTGESLTDEEITSLRQCQHHFKGYDMCYELYKSAFDIDCHLSKETYWREIQAELYKMFMPLPIDKEDWSWGSDRTLWVGTQHAAAYYQYIWSEMLAANIFEEFEEAGMQDDKQMVKLGNRFRSTYLSLGGSVNAKTVFRQMTGRDPSFESLLRRYPNN